MATKTLHSPMSNHLTGHGGTVTGMETEFSRVPVVTHIITDDDIGVLQVCILQMHFPVVKNVFEILS